MNSWFSSALIATFVSSLVTAFGWFVSHRNLRRLEEARRGEKVLDVQTALIAEIKTNTSRFDDTDLQAHADEMRDLILTSRKAYTPFVPRYAGTMVFDAVIKEIHILPTDTIQDVIAYYKQEYALRDLAEDLRGDEFSKLDKTRKAGIYVPFNFQIETAKRQGKLAIGAMLRNTGQHE